MRYQINYNYYFYGNNGAAANCGGGQHYHFGDGQGGLQQEEAEALQAKRPGIVVRMLAAAKRQLALTDQHRQDQLAVWDEL